MKLKFVKSYRCVKSLDAEMYCRKPTLDEERQIIITLR